MLGMVHAAVEAATNSAPFFILEVVGTIAFAVSGVMAAARARMDWLGAIVLAMAVAIGGGTLRDFLLGQLPVAWLEQTWPVFVSIGTAIVMLAILRIWPRAHLERSTPILIADAAGLSTFVVLGTQIGLNASLTPVMAVMLGVLTGVGGGVIRDVLTGNKPTVLVGQIYAVAGLVGGAWFAFLVELGVNTQVSVWSGVAVVFVIRMLAISRNWNLPRALPTRNGQSDEADSSASPRE
jgi:uncharacterized membrane protein YeiH